jgi:RES domain
LPLIPSLSDPERRENYYELRFLHEFTRDLIEPVVLDGREHIDYVPTQVVTEYIRWLPALAIDGILFASAQNGGTSCVIFCGPEAYADAGKETDKTMLRLKNGPTDYPCHGQSSHVLGPSQQTAGPERFLLTAGPESGMKIGK